MTDLQSEAQPDEQWRIVEPLTLTPLLTAALEVFHELGYHGASVRDIAKPCRCHRADAVLPPRQQTGHPRRADGTGHRERHRTRERCGRRCRTVADGTVRQSRRGRAFCT